MQANPLPTGVVASPEPPSPSVKFSDLRAHPGMHGIAAKEPERWGVKMTTPPTFTARRGPPEDVGEHIELRPTEPVHGPSGQPILAFCIPLDEARELGRLLVRLADERRSP